MPQLAFFALILAGGQLMNINGICLDSELAFQSEPKRVADFTLARVYNKTRTGDVGLYIGHNPNVNPENSYITSEKFSNSLKSPKKIKIKGGGIVGVSNNLESPLFHVYGKKKRDIEWVAEHVNFCTKASQP